MSEHNQQPGPGQCGADREVFERVWRRVMPEDRPDCPFTLYSEEAAAPEQAQGEGETAAPAALPVPAARPAEPTGDGADLQGFIAAALSDWRTCQAMARRASGGSRRTLAAMAADQRRHAGRLAAAYFLLSGVRFWPPGGGEVPPGDWMAVLRQRYWAEQRMAQAYRAAAGRTGDAVLRELYLDLAGDEEAHGALIRGILERM